MRSQGNAGLLRSKAYGSDVREINRGYAQSLLEFSAWSQFNAIKPPTFSEVRTWEDLRLIRAVQEGGA